MQLPLPHQQRYHSSAITIPLHHSITIYMTITIRIPLPLTLYSHTIAISITIANF